ncbi:hypothetical protein CCAN2_910005 [Capnocytophaga canimorsus]|nr:hypothetical protein CCAN2_910005 [Capnocytophaga canimorsus]
MTFGSYWPKIRKGIKAKMTNRNLIFDMFSMVKILYKNMKNFKTLPSLQSKKFTLRRGLCYFKMILSQK